MNLFKQFQSGLIKTSAFLSTNILDVLSTKKIDQEMLDEIESILLSSDTSPEVTNQLIKKIQSSKFFNKLICNFETDIA
jgi:signal recognition particle GTPase